MNMYEKAVNMYKEYINLILAEIKSLRPKQPVEIFYWGF